MEQVTRSEDGDHEHLTAVSSFLDCLDRATAQNNAYVPCRERLMHNDQETQSLRVVDPINDDGVFGQSSILDETVVVAVICGTERV